MNPTERSDKERDLGNKKRRLDELIKKEKKSRLENWEETLKKSLMLEIKQLAFELNKEGEKVEEKVG